jgi:type II secretion system protein H
VRAAPGSRRAGFTLAEVAVVLAIMAIIAAAVAPALPGLGEQDPAETSAGELERLLRRARTTALQQAVTVRVTIDPESGRYWVDQGDDDDRRPLTEGVLGVQGVRIVAEGPRASFRFEPNGAAAGEPVEVRGARIVRIGIDRWTGGMHVTTP